MKFAHIADTHIRNLKYHREYREVFSQLYQTLRDEGVDYIIHCGDIAHTKTQISPEFVEMASDFFQSLSSIAPTYIILGNHDGNLKNKNRQDALTPIIQALNLPNLHLLKDSQEVQIDDKFTLNVLSVFDEDNWLQPTDSGKINIALYHGCISGVKTDTGYNMSHGDHDQTIFKNFDFAFLGDIHKTDQAVDFKGRIRYPGSTIQQNHGETNDKGILIWDIEDRWQWKVDHFPFQNPKPFVTIEIDKEAKIPELDIPEGARVRLAFNEKFPLDVVTKLKDVARHRFKPESITHIDRSLVGPGRGQNGLAIKKENLRSAEVQERLIATYLEPYELSDDELSEVYTLNAYYNRIIEENEGITRNIEWSLQSFEWDNLFNYGRGNSIDFTHLHGIVGIFGKNFSGKSSIIDGMLYTLFNKSSKGERKNLNIINQKQHACYGCVTISVGDEEYVITRESEKYIKKLKGIETVEAKTALDFRMNLDDDETQELNGLTRNETDKIIQRTFGTFDDFLITSMTSQFGTLQFINEGPTKRKEIFGKFLDLGIFDHKFKLAKDAVAETRGALKRLEGRKYDEEIEEATQVLHENQMHLEEHSERCMELLTKISENEAEVVRLQTIIEQTPTQLVDITNVARKIKEKSLSLLSTAATNQRLKNELQLTERAYETICNEIEQFDAEDLNQKKARILELESLIKDDQRTLVSQRKDYKRIVQKQKLLDSVPCGNSFPACRFIADAYTAVAGVPELTAAANEVKASITAFNAELAECNPEAVREYLKNYEAKVHEKHTLSSEISDADLQIQRNIATITRLKRELSDLNAKKAEWEGNKENIENLERTMSDRDSIKRQIVNFKSELKECENKKLDYYRVNGSLEQKLETIKETKQEYLKLRKEYSAHDLFLRCMHSSGISYEIIKKQIPIINQEVSRILSNIVDFKIFFEDDGNKMNIFIQHPGETTFEARPLEMGSGAEKTIAAMAIRLALLSVSNLPKGDIFILDEPGVALDEENMEGFIRLLELIKTYFKTVLLISHLDSLKDCVDMQLTIENNDGYAHVKH